jgi:hypothetical protein
MILVAAALSLGGAKAERMESVKEYVKRTERLWGIAECTVRREGVVTLVDADDALILSTASGQRVGRIELRPGESCLLSDMHHASIQYEVQAVGPETVRITVVDAFQFPGLQDKRDEFTATVSPYARSISPQKDRSYTAEECRTRLREIIVPEFSCKNASGREALAKLQAAVIQSDSFGVGVPLVFDPVLYDRTSVTISFEDVSAWDALQIMTLIAGVQCSVQDGHVAVFSTEQRETTNTPLHPTADPPAP